MTEFPTTAWTQIVAAESTADRDRLLRQLLGAYWQPLYVFARRKGVPEAEAGDAVQGFCAQLLERGLDPALSPRAGRLRSYLRVSFDRYLTDAWRSETAQKRGGGENALPIDTELVESDARALHALGPEEAFELAFTQRSLQIALERLRAEFNAGKWQGPWAAFASTFEIGERPSQQEVAARHGMNPNQLKQFLFRVRRRYRELVDDVTQGSCASPEMKEAETRVLGGASRRL